MKKVFVLLTMIGTFAGLFAQSPQKMSYQAVIRNNNSELVANTVIGMKISILEESVTGNAVFVETHNPLTNANGLVSLEIGSGSVESGTFSGIDWANGLYFIKTETDPAGGNNYNISGTSQLLSVPYALHAKTAESLSGGGGFTHHVGEFFEGGIVYHVYRNTQGEEHGLIVSLTDLSTSAEWGQFTNVPNCESAWNGENNTAAIISAGTSGIYAGGLCAAYTGGGFTDWYLPSIQELIMLWNNLYPVNKVITSVTGGIVISNNFYWSSTESSGNSAWEFPFDGGDSGYHFDNNKSNSNRVRAIRAF